MTGFDLAFIGIASFFALAIVWAATRKTKNSGSSRYVEFQDVPESMRPVEYTYSDFRRDVLDENVSLDDIIAKCGGKVPEKPPLIVADCGGIINEIKSYRYPSIPGWEVTWGAGNDVLRGICKPGAVILDGGKRIETPVIYDRKTKFKPGDWVRDYQGRLCVVHCDWWHENQNGEVVSVKYGAEKPYDLLPTFKPEELTPAYPKKGEWWRYVGAPYPFKCWMDYGPNVVGSDVLDGRLVPANFGKGNKA